MRQTSQKKKKKVPLNSITKLFPNAVLHAVSDFKLVLWYLILKCFFFFFLSYIKSLSRLIERGPFFKHLKIKWIKIHLYPKKIEKRLHWKKNQRLSMCFKQFIYFHLFPSTLNFTLQFETDLINLLSRVSVFQLQWK